MNVYELPTHIDDPAQFMIWSADEVFPLGIALVIGVLIGQVFIALVAGQAFVYVYRRYKNMRPDGYLNHLLYSFGYIQNAGSPFQTPSRNGGFLRIPITSRHICFLKNTHKQLKNKTGQ